MGPGSGKCWWLFRRVWAPQAREHIPAQLWDRRVLLCAVQTEPEVLSVTAKRNIQNAKTRLQLKPGRFKSRPETPQTPSREPTLTDEGKWIKALTILQDSAAPSRPSQRQIWALQSRAATHYPPNFALTTELPKPPLEWILTNKFHSKETNWSFCAMSCSTNVPFRVA